MLKPLLSRLSASREFGTRVLITLSPDETTFAVIGTRDALTFKNVVHVSAYEPYIVKSVGEDEPPPYGQVIIELFRGTMPIPQKKIDVLSAFFMHGLQQVLGGRWARGFAVVVQGASSLGDCLSGYQEDILRQALRQPLTGARKISFERRDS